MFSSLTIPRSSTQMRLGLPYFFSINSTGARARARDRLARTRAPAPRAPHADRHAPTAAAEARPPQLLTEPALSPCRRGIAAFEQVGHLLPAVARGTVESGLFAKMGDHFLAWSPGGAHRFAQRPIFVSLPIDGATVAAKEHGPHHRRQQFLPAMGSSPLHAPTASGYPPIQRLPPRLPSNILEKTQRLTNLG